MNSIITDENDQSKVNSKSNSSGSFINSTINITPKAVEPEDSLYFDSLSNMRSKDDAVILGINSFTSKFSKAFRKFTKFFLPLDFVADLFGYLGARLRIFTVLSSVLTSVIAMQFESVKKLIVRKLFWGRGNVFRFAIQFVAAFLVVITILLGGYRSRITEAATTEVLVAKSEGYSNDLAVQSSSTKTVISENSVRFNTIDYVVKGGDTLSRIAEYHGISVDAILWANNMTAFDVLQPGITLKIPPGDGLFVTVQRNDTVDSLSEKYKAAAQNIVEYNYLVAPFELEVGQKLFLPGGEKDIPKPVIAVKKTTSFGGTVTTRTAGGTGSATAIDTSVGKFLQWPVAGGAGHLSQCYSGYHNGVDIASKASPDVVAAAPGIVTLAGCQSGSCPSGEIGGRGLAWTVVVDHGNGFSTVYGHLSTGDIYVKNGQAVSRGQRLGRMGQSGTAYGIHLHFMLVKSGTWNWRNPSPYLTTGICGY
jgi:murein DD-endopeptidase MepM/ murein hydrolase activator NlpD